MPLPAPARSHHTVWVRAPGRRAVPLRYALEGDALICVGDDGLAGVPSGARVEATVHEIQFGPPLAEFAATVVDLDPETLPEGLLWEVIGHRADPDPRRHRIVALRPA